MEAAKETVNNLINTATNMVYGNTNTSTTGTETGTGQHQHGSLLDDGTATSTGNVTGGQEPVSGQTGAGTANQPYDAGNTTGEPTNTTSTASSGPPTSTNPAATTTGASSSENEVAKSSATANTAQDVGSAPPESGAAPEAKQQGAANPSDEPDAVQSKAIADKKEAADDTLESGDGSKTHVGGASGGQSGPDSTSAGPKPLTGGGGATAAQEKEKEALGSTSKEPGTGEQYIKSSGVQADGGDFDASNAGAGREADRLLEEKGIHREGPNTGTPVEVPGQKAAVQSAAGEKPSLGQKIKDKLHIGSKDKP